MISIAFLLSSYSIAINDNKKNSELGVALTSREIHAIKDLKEMVLGFTGKSRMTAIPFSFAEILNIDSTNITYYHIMILIRLFFMRILLQKKY